MQIITQEHYDIIEFFDRRHKHLRLDKEAKEFWAKGNIYQNGETNNIFLAFREGVAYGKATARE